MAESLLDLLMPPCSGNEHLIYGVVIGIVTNNQDEDGLGRVRLRFPWFSNNEESAWARVAVPMAGKGRGTYFLPEVDDEVLVAFEHGDMRFPFVVGALWNGKDTPPGTNSDGKNNRRMLTSRSGHTILLDDTDGSEQIAISDKDQKNSILIDVANNKISITADTDIAIESKNGKVTISGKGIELKSEGAVKVEARKDMNLQASGQMTIKGATINLN
jgi:uncharacterized protein involved in type VI secretion and phage assembly